MSVRFATQLEIEEWDKLILSNPDGGNVFSSFEFAMQKETGGYTAVYLMIDELAITVLQKNVPMLGKFWYLPKGPEVTSFKDLWNVLHELEPFAKKYGVFAIRLEPELDRDQQPTFSRHGLKKSRPIIPNPSTITLDVSDKLEKILTGLPQKGRYAIKRAERDGVTVKKVESNEKNCQKMYELLSETAEGQFGIRDYDYYRTFWQRFETADYGQLFFAYFDKKVVAGAYAMTFGSKSTYKDGASVRNRTVYGASHFLQWEVIKWAKSKGSTLHDFCGSPPSEEINNPDHKHYGIGLFKTAFNKTVTDYVGCYDLVINPKKYKLWIKLGERIAQRLHYYKHHDSYY
ncbi:MAG: peptidoglycan bridge formation glycyltransferase FemA/FemB family protein [Candidatus Saccharibacteria bacterium]